MRMSMAVSAVAGVSVALASSAQANFIDVDLAGWVANGGYTNAGNTNLTINLPVGAQVLSAEYIDLEFESFGISWNNEFRLSLNDSVNFIGGFWDVGIVGTTGDPGPFGPVSESFANSPGIGGPPIDLTTGELYIETYATFTGGANDFHVVSAGTLRIEWVPAPGRCGPSGSRRSGCGPSSSLSLFDFSGPASLRGPDRFSTLRGACPCCRVLSAAPASLEHRAPVGDAAGVD